MLSSETTSNYNSPARASRFWIAIAACAVLYLPSLFWSLGLDQNIFAEIGSLILKGQRPYVDAWDVKPPNVFYTYAAFEWLFGQREIAVRFADYFFTLFACGSIYLGVERRLRTRTVSDWLRSWAPSTAAILMALTLLSLGLSDTAQTESFALGFILIAAYFAVSDRPIRILLAGIMIAIATFYKSTNAVFLLPLVLEICFARILTGMRAKAIALLIAGFVGWSALELLSFAALGILPEYLHIALAVLQHHANEPGDVSVFALLRALWVSVDIWTLFILLGIAVAVSGRDKTLLKILRLPLLYLAAGLLAVYVQHKGWGYHYVVTHPGLISSSAIAGVYLVDRLRKRSHAVAYVVISAVVVLTLFLTPSARRRLHYSSDALRDRATYISSLGAKESLYYPACTDSLAAYLLSHTTPKDSIFILGEEPGVYWRANRQPASRYIYALLFTSGVMKDDELKAIGPDLERKRPTAIIIERFDTTSFRGRPETSESLVQSDSSFGGLKALLTAEYNLADTVCGKFLVYRLR